MNGLPIVGPYALAGIDRADAAVRAVQNDSRYSDEVDGAKRYGAEVAAEHPIAEAAGEIGGGIVGTAPLVLAAPAAFGAGAGGLIGRSALSAASGLALGGADSFEGRAQGLAVLPDTREAIVDPLRQRAAGANARLAADVDTHLGPTLDPAAFQAEWQRAYGEAVPPLYRDALSQPVQVDTSGVLETIGRLGAHEKGGAELVH